MASPDFGRRTESAVAEIDIESYVLITGIDGKFTSTLQAIARSNSAAIEEMIRDVTNTAHD